MARIAGINIPMNKHVWVGLTAIYGIGRSQARKACEGAGVKPETKVKDLTEPEVAALRSQISRPRGRGRPAARSLDEHQALDGSRRVPRHPSSQGLPMRGQRTRTNARTRKGPRKAAVKLNAPPGKA
jgi:small subunit ribosomal protein S13